MMKSIILEESPSPNKILNSYMILAMFNLLIKLHYLKLLEKDMKILLTIKPIQLPWL